MNRDLIIKLIEQDIKHSQLLNGLNQIGLYDNEKYTLDIVSILMNTLGIPNTKESDSWLDLYHSTMLNIPINLSTEETHSRAIILLDSLSKI